MVVISLSFVRSFIHSKEKSAVTSFFWKIFTRNFEPPNIAETSIFYSFKHQYTDISCKLQQQQQQQRRLRRLYLLNHDNTREIVWIQKITRR